MCSLLSEYLALLKYKIQNIEICMIYLIKFCEKQDFIHIIENLKDIAHDLYI